MANQDRQFNSQEARDKQQQTNFERTFNANDADRTFSRDMANKNYDLAHENQKYNFGQEVKGFGGNPTTKFMNAADEAQSRAAAELAFKSDNRKALDSLARGQSYNQAMGQTLAEKKNYNYHMNKAYDMGYRGASGKTDAPATYYDAKTNTYTDKPDDYGRHR